jgi:hypothetical protein
MMRRNRSRSRWQPPDSPFSSRSYTQKLVGLRPPVEESKQCGRFSYLFFLQIDLENPMSGAFEKALERQFIKHLKAFENKH